MTADTRHEVKLGAELVGIVLALSIALCAGDVRAGERESSARGALPLATSAPATRGDSVFHGLAGGGTCFTCHQANAKGLAGLAPDLTDDVWLHGDGSLMFIRHTIRMGVPKPKQAAAPMPPMGGANLSMMDLHAVADYVYSLSHKAPETGH